MCILEGQRTSRSSQRSGRRERILESSYSHPAALASIVALKFWNWVHITFSFWQRKSTRAWNENCLRKTNQTNDGQFRRPDDTCETTGISLRKNIGRIGAKVSAFFTFLKEETNDSGKSCGLICKSRLFPFPFSSAKKWCSRAHGAHCSLSCLLLWLFSF